MGLFDRFKNKETVADGTAVDRLPDTRVEAAADSAAAPATSLESANTDEANRRSGLFARFRQGLKRTTQILNTDVRDLFKQEGELLDEEFLNRLYAILIRTDMGTGPAGLIRDEIRSQFRGRVVHMSEILETIRAKLNELAAQEEEPILFAADGPTVIMVVGVNGSGKTTSIAKLAYRFVQAGK